MDFHREHHVDLHVRKTKEAYKYFQKMICEMPAEKITMKELADRAMIHRKTFYLHYTSIEALYQDMMAEIADGTYEEMGKIKPPYSHKEVNRISSLITLSRISTFLVVSSLERYRQWVSDGKKLPLDGVIELTGKLLDEGISGLTTND